MSINVEMMYEGGKPIQPGEVLTRLNRETEQKIVVYALDEGGVNNKAVIHSRVGQLGIQHEVEFRLKDNRESTVSYNKRVTQWLRRHGYIV